MSFNIRFDGQVVLVTGGTRGIGHAIANLLSSLGAKVIITGTTNNPPENCKGFTYISANFSTQESISFFLENIERMDKVDVCINCAGFNKIEDFHNISLSAYEMLQNCNSKAPFFISQKCSELMKKNKYGRIVNIGSIWSHITKIGRSNYSLSKHALVGFSKTIAIELAKYNILVNTLSPGFTSTELTKKSLSDNEIKEISSQIPIKRMADPREIANAVVFLASNKNTYIVGQNIIIDGGFCVV